jgi:UDP-N-acetylmuramoylalanine--D-glutamate ligase
VIRISTGQSWPTGYFLDGSADARENGDICGKSPISPASATLRGRHNAQNALAAVAAFEAAGWPRRDRGGPASFPGLAHRMELVGRDRVLFVNDSKATNAEAAAPALSTYERIYWIAGGLPKEGGIEALRPLFRASPRPI